MSDTCPHNQTNVGAHPCGRPDVGRAHNRAGTRPAPTMVVLMLGGYNTGGHKASPYNGRSDVGWVQYGWAQGQPIRGIIMAYDPKKHHRRSVRLKGYDYSQAGAYFVTICVNFGQCRLGEVRDGAMFPSPAGEMISECWYALPERFPNIELDVFGLMPNHSHGILVIDETGLNANNNPVVLGNMVGAFKSISTNEYIKGVKEQGWQPFYKRFWQRGFYDHIIRNEAALNAIRAYIINNPANWAEDKLHHKAPPNVFNRLWKRSTDDDHINHV